MLLCFVAQLAAAAITYDPLNPPGPPLVASDTHVWAPPGESRTFTIKASNPGSTAVHLNELVVLGSPGFTMQPAEGAVVPAGGSHLLRGRWTPQGETGGPAVLLVRAREGVAVLDLSGGTARPAAPKAAEPPGLAERFRLAMPPRPPAPQSVAPPSGTALAGEPLLIGRLDRQQLDPVMEAALPRFDGCYQAERARAPALTGRIDVRFVVLASGAVGRASLGSTSFAEGAVEACVTAVATELKFPPQAGEGLVVVAQYGLSFAP